MSALMVTYHSKNNSDPNQQWMGFIEINKNRLGIWFPGATEDEVKEKVRKFWRREQEKREAEKARTKAKKPNRNTEREDSAHG